MINVKLFVKPYGDMFFLEKKCHEEKNGQKTNFYRVKGASGARHHFEKVNSM